MSQTFTQLTPNLWVTQSEPFATNSGIFLSEGQACLIDPGIPPEALTEIARFVADRGATPHAIVLTHGHWDHILGPEHFPGVNVIAHTRYADVLRKRSADLKRQVAAWEAESGIRRARPFVLPKPTYAFDAALILTLGDLQLRIFHAPGHAPDQCVIDHAESGALWAADMLSDIEIPFVMDSLRAYEATLARLDELDIRVLVPGHGAPTTDPAEIRARIAQDRAYLADLRTYVTRAVEAGKTLKETVAASDAVLAPHPTDDANAHRWNVEGVYAELGGAVEGPVGWDQEWLA